MAWKEIRNNQPPVKEISYTGQCPKYHKEATVTGHYFGNKWAETDHFPTYSLSGYRCTLNHGLCSFEEQCPLMPAKYL